MRTFGVLLRIAATEASVSDRARHKESYASKLACTSSCKLRLVVSSVCRCSRTAVTANSVVSTTEVESQMRESSESRGNRIARDPQYFPRGEGSGG